MCLDCQSSVPNLVEDFASGDIVCRDCGAVLVSRLIDTRSEWRSFANDGSSGADDPSRVGGPQDPLLFGVDGEDETGPGFAIESTLISTMDKGTGISRDLARTQSKTSLKASDRNLILGFKNISLIADRMGLPRRIADRAKHIFKRTEQGKLLKGKPVDGIIAACVYIACRIERVTRTFKEIALATLIPKKDIGRCFKALCPLLFPSSQKPGDNESSSSSSSSPVESHAGTPPQSPIGPTFEPIGTVNIQDFMARFCSNLSLPIDIQKAANIVCGRAQTLDCVSGKSPVSIAAAGIYMVTMLFPQHRRPARDIAFVAGVSEITIRNTFKELYPHRFSLITQDIAPKFMTENMPLS